MTRDSYDDEDDKIHTRTHAKQNMLYLEMTIAVISGGFFFVTKILILKWLTKRAREREKSTPAN